MKTSIKRIIGISLSMVLLATSVFLTGGTVVAETTINNNVFSDNFDDNQMDADWNWIADCSTNEGHKKYSASESEGKMQIGANDGSGIISLRHLTFNEYKRVNQHVSVEFTSAPSVRQRVWARVGNTDTNAWTDVNGYYVDFANNNQGTGGVLSVYKNLKEDGGGNGTVIAKCDSPSVTNGQSLKMEMVVTGINPTVITVNFYKYSDSLKDFAMVGTNTIKDKTEELQRAGTAGISVTNVASSNIANVAFDNFAYTSTDNAEGNYYVTENVGEGTKTFGQVVALDPSKTYVLSAEAIDNSDDNTIKKQNTLWVEYQDNDQVGDNSRLVWSISQLKHNKVNSELAYGVTYNEKYTLSATFNFSQVTNNKYLANTNITDSECNAKVRTLVGFRLDKDATTAGTYTNFRLYAEDDPDKTNLLVNGDFKMGFYGWSDNAANRYNGTVLSGEDTVAKNGYVTFGELTTKYSYYETFKNNGFVVEGDANKNQEVNIADLFHLKANAATYEYYGAVDSDANSVINDTDLLALRATLLGTSGN